MQVLRFFRRLFLGKHYIPSRAEFKRVMLTGYLATLAMAANIIYILVDSHSGNNTLTWLNVLFCAISVGSILLLRTQHYTTSKLLLFICNYLLIFFFCALEPQETGVPFFYILLSIGATALFGMEQWRWAILLTILGSVFFLITNVWGFKLMEIQFSESYVQNNFVLNFFVFLSIAILILYFMIDLNFHAEKELATKQQEALNKNRELTKLNAELDRFVYSVSHDLRSPLSSITGLVNIGQHVQNIDEAKLYFNMIGERVQAQEFFIQEIIDFYRNTRTQLNSETLDVKRHVEEVVSEYKTANINIEFEVTIEAGCMVLSDRVRLRSVLGNIVGNAIKYHDHAKAHKFIAIKAVSDGAVIQISVADNGRGIEKQHLPKIFDMFYRASHDSKGSGLGLFIVRETIEKMGGEIKVESQLGTGSTFSFTLPKAG